MTRLSLSLYCLFAGSAALVLGGCGGEKQNGSPGGGGQGGVAAKGGTDGAVPTTRALRIVSAPVQNASTGERTRYRVVASQAGATYSLKRAPMGAVVDNAGVVTWTPTDSQGGDQKFEVEVQLNGETAAQNFTVTTATATVQAALTVDPASASVSTVSVDSPLSKVHGTTVQIDPGSLEPKHPVRVSIAAVDNAPVPPAARVARVPAVDLQPVELGPSGTTFRHPVKVQLPVSANLSKRGRPDVLTYDYGTGRWDKVKVLSFDANRGVAVAEISHFSTYVVAPAAKIFSPDVGRGGPKCKDSLVVRAPVSLAFTDVPASVVNNYDGGATTLAEIIAGMKSGQALKSFITANAHSGAGGAGQSGFILSSATKGQDGKFSLRVTTDSHQSAFVSVPASLAADDPDLTAWLNGSRVHFVFPGLASSDKGASARVEVSLYLVADADADRVPTEVANALGAEDLAADKLAAIDFDDDCDEAPNAFDPTPNGDPPPDLTAKPDGAVRVAIGRTATLAVTSNVAAARLIWSTSDPAMALSEAADGHSVTIRPAVTGTFRVTVVATAGDTESSFGWDVFADPQVINLPPAASIAASDVVVRAGEAVTLTALGKDPEHAPLVFTWKVRNGAALSATTGDQVKFIAPSTGDYTVTLVANDGLLDSAEASLTITVLSATANRPPAPPTVSPMNAILQHAAGVAVSLGVIASSIDPDGDTVTYDFIPDPTTPAAVSLMKNGASATITTTRDGVFLFYVSAQDARGAVSPFTPIKLQVLQTLSDKPVDADGDGFPAGSDCNDNDPKIYPGAQEICGDNIDQNCDGRDVPVAACDNDGDHFTPKDGDCDDNNASVNPSIAERCDGVDNNCDGAVDEGFGIGKACRTGVGACQVTGTTICSATFVQAVCNGSPTLPQAETCDGIDNDCNGEVDDLPAGTGGTVMACGGCNTACASTPNTVPACTNGGCVAPCADGFVDLDRLATNGCECAVTNKGVEICDGIDNDCNGVIDETVAETFYTGPMGTLGVGACDAGLRICQGGKLVVQNIPRLPEVERCDGLDNDCNGRVDESFDLQTDRVNCGGCGIVCNAVAKCEMGRCVGPGDAGAEQDAPVLAPGIDANVGLPDGGTTVGPPGEILATCPGPNGASLCTDLARDRGNCGACGRVCGANEFCAGGHCATGGDACGAPKKLCPDPANPAGAYCTDPMFDPNNCGGCGVRCNNAPCQMGVCGMGGPVSSSDGGAPLCPVAAQNICPGPNGGTFCTDFLHDSSNCGGCDFRCGNGIFCEMGKCTGTAPTPGPLSCTPGSPNACIQPDGSAFCTNLLSDPKNCSACGVVCAAGNACQSGKCVVSGGTGGAGGTACPGPLPSACRTPTGEAYCADLNIDLANCGACGKGCPAGNRCEMGICHAIAGGTCPGTFPNTCPSAAGGTLCTDFMKDPGNCGGCGIRCDNGIYCDKGKCTATPPAPSPISCPGGTPNGCTRGDGSSYCTNVLKDPGNCGGCGSLCPSGKTCSNGTCVDGPIDPALPPPATCPGSAPAQCRAASGEIFCSDLMNDTANCGMCNHACPGGSRCQMGVCSGGGPVACPPTTPSVCQAPVGMYCAEFSRDSQNCGACGIRCPDGVFCDQGKCSGMTPPPPPATQPMTCPPDLPNGCIKADGNATCTNLLTDQGNCGRCGVACPAGVLCQMGVCGGVPDGGALGTCPATASATCANPNPYCADLMTDIVNCGACGRGCPPGARCEAGVCSGAATSACSPQAPNLCEGANGGTFCTDVSRDAANCGGCNLRCPTGNFCNGGMCTTMSPPPAASAACPPYNPNGCAGPNGVNYCVNVLSDPANCGRCGNLCPNNSVCSAGTCTATAPVDAGSTPIDAGALSCPAGAPAMCHAATGETFCSDPMTDTANCGSCFRPCPYGARCQGGVCTGGTPNCGPATPNTCSDAARGTFCTNYLNDPANCGGCSKQCPVGAVCDMGTCSMMTSTPPPTYCPPGSPNACQSATTAATLCTNLLTDPGNCGRCGAPCAPGVACLNGVCGGGNSMPCPPALPYKCDSAAGGAYYCTDGMTDAANCGGCFHPCPAGNRCQMGVCAPTGTSSCPPSSPGVCQRPDGSSHCADFANDPGNCGGCDKFCPGGFVCRDGRCLDGAATCAPPFTGCPGSCAILSDDPANCGTCGNKCTGGVCEAAMCRPGGSNAFGGPCARSGECVAGGICFDSMRFSWPGGYCTTPCDADRPCAANQACIIANGGGGFGTCRAKCATTTDCGGRGGYMCLDGLCQPDCRMAPGVCNNGSTCDATGHCVAGGPPAMCPPQLRACGDQATGKQYCADLLRDQGNCGACGSACQPGAACLDGKCQNTGASFPGLMACMVPGGGPACVAVYRDNNNCGACGKVCPAGTTCQGGLCGNGPTCSAQQKLCTDPPSGKTYCTDVNFDPGNCGGCGNVCPAGAVCQMGTCGSGTPPMCPGGLQQCLDTAGQPSCVDVARDARNCGKCGLACVSGVCQDYKCTATSTADAGAPPPACQPPYAPCKDATGFTYCSDFQGDSKNCGGCGILCPNAYVCVMGGCKPAP